MAMAVKYRECGNCGGAWQRAWRYETRWLRRDYNIGERLTGIVWPSGERGFLCAVKYDGGVAINEYVASEDEARALIGAAITILDSGETCAVSGCGAALSRVEAALPDSARESCLSARDRCGCQGCGMRRLRLTSKGWRCRRHAPERLARVREARESARRRARYADLGYSRLIDTAGLMLPLL